MSFNVRVYGHRGLEQLLVRNPLQFSSDSVFVLMQPYEWRQTLVADTVAVSSSAQPAPDLTQILRIEVADGESIRYEINPPNRPGGVLTATVASPKLSGNDQFYFRQGWTLSIINAAALP